MKKAQEQVKQFMIQAGQYVPTRPEAPGKAIQTLRTDLIYEEFSELETALIDQDLIKIADGLADLLYVTLGTAVACGLDIEPFFNEVHENNMLKFKTGYKRPDGKWVKDPNHPAPHLFPILDSQLHGTPLQQRT